MRLIIPKYYYQKLRAYVRAIPDCEISGFGKLKKIDYETFALEDLRIFNQVVTAGSTNIDRNALGDFYDEIIEQGGDLVDWKLWWHSHAQMGTFFSQTDVKTIGDFDNDLKEENWMMSLVTNVAGDILVRADIFAPIRCTLQNLTYVIEENTDKKLEQDVFDEVAEKVQIVTSGFSRSKRSIDWSRVQHRNTIIGVDGRPITVLLPSPDSPQTSTS